MAESGQPGPRDRKPAQGSPAQGSPAPGSPAPGFPASYFPESCFPEPGDGQPGSPSAGQGLSWSRELDFETLMSVLNEPAPWNTRRPDPRPPHTPHTPHTPPAPPAPHTPPAPPAPPAPDTPTEAHTPPAPDTPSEADAPTLPDKPAGSDEPSAPDAPPGPDAPDKSSALDAPARPAGPAAPGPSAASFPPTTQAAAEGSLARGEAGGGESLGFPDDQGDQEAIQAAMAEAMLAGRSREVPVAEAAGRVAEFLPPGPDLAAWLAAASPRELDSGALPGVAASFRRLASWAQAGELAAVAELASRSAAADDKIGVDGEGRPARVPDEATAQVALALSMSRYGACWWADLGVTLSWRLAATGAALAAGQIDLTRARLIAEATALLDDETAQAVEAAVLPGAGERTTSQLRAGLRRAVIAADPDGADRRRIDAERRAKVSLYPDQEGTAALAGQNLPGTRAAAAMARISAMARALRASGADGGMDLLRAQVFIGLLLGTLPAIPPAPGAPPDQPPAGPPDDPPGPPAPGDPAPGGAAPGGAAPGGAAPGGAAQRNRGPGRRVPSGPAPSAGARGGPAPGRPAPGRPASSGPATGGPAPGRPASNGPASSGPARSGPATGGPAPAAPAPDPSDPSHAPGEDAASDDDVPRDDYLDDPLGGDPAWAQPDALADLDDDEGELGAINPNLVWPPLPVLPPPSGAGPGPGTVPGSLSGQSAARPSLSRPPPGQSPPGQSPGLLDLTVSWETLAGTSPSAGHVGRLGPVTPAQAREIAEAAAADPAAQWRVILTDQTGAAMAVARVSRVRAARSRDGAGTGSAGTGRAAAGGAGTGGAGTGRAGAGGAGTGGAGTGRAGAGGAGTGGAGTGRAGAGGAGTGGAGTGRAGAGGAGTGGAGTGRAGAGGAGTGGAGTGRAGAGGAGTGGAGTGRAGAGGAGTGGAGTGSRRAEPGAGLVGRVTLILPADLTRRPPELSLPGDIMERALRAAARAAAAAAPGAGASGTDSAGPDAGDSAACAHPSFDRCLPAGAAAQGVHRGTGPDLPVPRLRTAGLARRPRPHPALAPGRTHLLLQSRPALPPPPHPQTAPRLAAHPAPARHIPVDHPHRPHLHGNPGEPCQLASSGMPCGRQ